MCKLPISYDEAIDYLKKSPMFNLSLSSNELFHSNFLYWIWKSNPDAFKKIINEFTDNDNWWRDNCEDKDIEVRREYKNFDLSIVKKTNSDVVILFVLENKVKSIPYAQQLIKYNAKIAEDNKKKNKKKNEEIPCYKLLLSLSDTFPDIEVENEKSLAGWKLKSYSDYVKILSELNLKDNFNIYLEDYCKYVESLIVCVERWDRFPDLTEDYNKQPFREYKYLTEAKELRMHVFYYKFNTAKLCCMLINKLSDKLSDKLSEKGNVQLQYFGKEDDSILLSDNNEYANYFHRYKDILVGVGYEYSNQGPILEVKVAKKTNTQDERIFYIIQIQDEKYEHGIIKMCERPALEGKIEGTEKYKNWVTNIPLRSSDPDIFSSDVLPQEYNGYNATYSMVYKYRKLKDDVKDDATVENVLNQIVSDVEELITQKLTTNN